MATDLIAQESLIITCKYLFYWLLAQITQMSSSRSLQQIVIKKRNRVAYKHTCRTWLLNLVCAFCNISQKST